MAGRHDDPAECGGSTTWCWSRPAPWRPTRARPPDLTRVFAALGKDITKAQALYWKKQNAGDRICGRYTVEETVKDHGYDTQKGIQLYSAIHNDVLAIEQTIGSPINTGLLQQFDTDSMVNIPAAWAQSLTESPQIAMVGATYEVEMINVLD